MATLDTLPNEILSLITNHLERPQDLLYLSLASRRLGEFAKLDGWKALLKGRFGFGGLDADARNSVHGLTTLYRNWDRKGFVARYLDPTEKVMSMNTWQPERWRGPQGQTMGYRPNIDSYEEMYGAWGERREVLAWSAGTQILLRTKETGTNIEKIRKREEGQQQPSGQTWVYDAFKHLNTWFTYKIPDSYEGRDDITALKLLRPHQRDLAYEEMVFGTASGQLSLLRVSPDFSETRVQNYETNRRGIGSISVSSSSTPMLAAVFADTSLALYPIDRDRVSDVPIAPSSEVKTILGDAPYGRIWSCEFLSEDRVAVGWGPDVEPIEVYHIGPDGLLSQPIRKFNFTANNTVSERPISVYPIIPVPATAQGGSNSGNTFLSGAYDGIIRLHDMRSPKGCETIFRDPTNDSPVYSLATQGLERIVSGVSMHGMIKIFDLRLSGCHAYHTTSLPSKSPPPPKTKDFAVNPIINRTNKHIPIISGGWNVYLNPRTPPPRHAYRHDHFRARESSPVYSLSIPSPTSQNLYAGLEGIVQSLTFHGIADEHPDPMLSNSIVYYASNKIDMAASYNPQQDVLNLGMYEQGATEDMAMQLLVQGGVASPAKVRDSKNIAEGIHLDGNWWDLCKGPRGGRDHFPPTPSAQRGGQGRRRGRDRGRGCVPA
ncbi:f-box domain [Pyrenophora seminiperda CCB06]|uniref:F-box domain n=1 Tax=Pyrenophora seminiperda CCB06 TaxID=1302712 RepID=A0A3M7MJI6_9PLEO|nr:f-box domain [Pyrenophora seminiperda CCB06]